MNTLRFAVRTATILLCVIPNQAQARKISVLSYQEMLAKSDLVVIATPISLSSGSTGLRTRASRNWNEPQA